jgi:hypothetical protein
VDGANNDADDKWLLCSRASFEFINLALKYTSSIILSPPSALFVLQRWKSWVVLYDIHNLLKYDRLVPKLYFHIY